MVPARRLIAVAIVIALGACSAVPPYDCVWAQKIAPDAGFEKRWTIHEKRQIVAHNELVDKFCRQR